MQIHWGTIYDLPPTLESLQMTNSSHLPNVAWTKTLARTNAMLPTRKLSTTIVDQARGFPYSKWVFRVPEQRIFFVAPGPHYSNLMRTKCQKVAELVKFVGDSKGTSLASTPSISRRVMVGFLQVEGTVGLLNVDLPFLMCHASGVDMWICLWDFYQEDVTVPSYSLPLGGPKVRLLVNSHH
jgi:hypothetical protein